MVFHHQGLSAILALPSARIISIYSKLTMSYASSRCPTKGSNRSYGYLILFVLVAYLASSCRAVGCDFDQCLNQGSVVRPLEWVYECENCGYFNLDYVPMQHNNAKALTADCEGCQGPSEFNGVQRPVPHVRCQQHRDSFDVSKVFCKGGSTFYVTSEELLSDLY
ncbi:hypothetical protein O181_024183 [Austropuccinia psidii MF-1]|uniref:Uncharacterized protein n=1 Tax=Austropuccinia psidii MF-1 TaxID=1389203 RepID=A0A9Q3CK98_9BASI|nr:hypothetical protein [Austropuccinia psidii MF-1]